MSDLVVVGAGVAGLSAAFYAGRLGMSVTVLDELGGGGQVVNGGEIDTYPGLAADVSGADFVGRLTEQALQFDVNVEFATATTVEREGAAFLVRSDGDDFASRAVIIATGSRPRLLGVAGESEFVGRGVSDCAVCDGGFFVGLPVLMVGGGDKALEGALHLARGGSAVTLALRGNEPDAVDYLRRSVRDNPSIKVLTGVEIQQITGDSSVEGVQLRNVADGSLSSFETRAVFVNIGTEPRSELVRGFADIDPDGRIVVDVSMSTTVHGVLAAGAVRSGTPDQLVTSVSDGVTAATTAAARMKD